MTYDLFATGGDRDDLERLAAALLAVDRSAEIRMDSGRVEIVTGDRIVVSFDLAGGRITVPYWYEGERAAAVIARLHEYAAVLTEIGGMEVEDMQTGEIVTGPGAPDAYARGVAIARGWTPPD
jgi:hypothetical protein